MTATPPSPVEADEMLIGGKGQYAKNGKPRINRKQTAVGVRDRATGQVRAKFIPNRRAEHVVPFVHANTTQDAAVCTEEVKVYLGLRRLREAVRHSSGEHVRNAAHVNGLESFWATVKRAHMGTFHRMSGKHLQRCIDEFAGRWNNRERDTIDQLKGIV